MARRLRWVLAALDDAESIASFIARDSEKYSRIVTRALFDAAKDLSRFPQMGRIVPQWNDPAVRERIIYSYRLIYRIKDGEIVVLAVVHGARRLPANLRNRG